MNIDEKIALVRDQIKQKLDENNIRITSISAYFDAERLQRDGVTRKSAIVVSVTEPKFDKKHLINIDTETLEPLYVQTDVLRFMEAKDYFTPRDDDHYD